MTWLTDEPPWFAFIVHPRDFRDMLTMPGAGLIRRNSATDAEFVEKVSSNPPVVLEDVVLLGSAVRGELVGTPRLPDAILTPDGHRAVVAAVELAVHRGAPVIGLGALTAPATAGGRALLRHVPRGVTVTNGNGLTAAVARENVVEAAAALGIGDSASVAVLGATGSVGHAASRLLADDPFELTLAGPRRERVLAMFDDLLDRVAAADGVAGVTGADVVLVLTSDASAKLTPDAVKEGAVVIDVSQPCNVLDEELPAFEEMGVTVVRGGSVRIPGYSCKRDFRLRSQADTFACLAETYVLAREGLREHSVGRPSAEYARHVWELARRHGIAAVPLEVARTREPEFGELTMEPVEVAGSESEKEELSNA